MLLELLSLSNKPTRATLAVREEIKELKKEGNIRIK
jgi:hypothetical protein